MKRPTFFFLLILIFSAENAFFAEEGSLEPKELTLTVQEAVDYARTNSRAIRSAAIDVDSKADARNHVLNVFCPDVSFSATVAKPNEYDSTYATLLNPLYEKAGMGSPIPSDYEREADKYSVIGTASISISWGLSIIENVKKANRDYEAGLISWEQVVKQNERDVKKLFYAMLLQQKTIENDKETLENTYQRYLNTEKSYRSGISPRLNVLQSHVTYQNMKRDVEKEEIAFKSQMKQFASEVRMGGVMDHSNYINAVIDETSWNKIDGYLSYAEQSPDARIVLGGGRDKSVGWFVEPTVIETSDPHFKSMEEEIFGPVLTVFPYDDNKVDEAVKLCDETSPYGLTGAVFGQDRLAVEKIADELRYAAGNFYINDKPTGAVVGLQPFGGARASGTNDKAGGEFNLIRWVIPRVIKETLVPAEDYRYSYMK